MKSPVKSSLQGVLKQLGLHERAKASWIYDVYWKVANREVVDDRQREIEFYRKALAGFRKGDLVFDIGANHGYKSDIFLRLGARVVAVEPDENCQRILKEKFLKLRLSRMPFAVVGKAVSDKSSRQKMWINAPGSALNTLSPKWADALRKDASRFGHTMNFGQCKEVETISMEQLLASYGAPYFVKIDVEGHELNVLRGMKRSVPYLSFEVNLPEFRPEGLDCVRALHGIDPEGEFNYTNDCRRGLELKRWIKSEEFSALLDTCNHRSIDVFWKSPACARTA